MVGGGQRLTGEVSRYGLSSFSDGDRDVRVNTSNNGGEVSTGGGTQLGCPTARSLQLVSQSVLLSALVDKFQEVRSLKPKY